MIEEAPQAFGPSFFREALAYGRLVMGPATGPRWRSWPASPESVRLARRFASSELAKVVETDADHVDDVVLLVSELITNAVNALCAVAEPDPMQKPIHLGIAVQDRWTHLLAVDSAPGLPEEAGDGPLQSSGRGIPIIKKLGALSWVEQGANDKTIHVVVTRTGVELTPEEMQSLLPGSGAKPDVC